MRRRAPRALGEALGETLGSAEPGDLLTRVQTVWPEVAGPAVAEESEPTSERSGTVTVACRSAVWTQELELLAEDLQRRLNERLGGAGTVAKLRFRTGSQGRP